MSAEIGTFGGSASSPIRGCRNHHTTVGKTEFVVPFPSMTRSFNLDWAKILLFAENKSPGAKDRRSSTKKAVES